MVAAIWARYHQSCRIDLDWGTSNVLCSTVTVRALNHVPLKTMHLFPEIMAGFFNAGSYDSDFAPALDVARYRVRLASPRVAPRTDLVGSVVQRWGTMNSIG